MPPDDRTWRCPACERCQGAHANTAPAIPAGSQRAPSSRASSVAAIAAKENANRTSSPYRTSAAVRPVPASPTGA